MPELIQDAASAEAIAGELGKMLSQPAECEALEARFAAMHAQLQRDASHRAAEAIEAIASGQPLVQGDA